MKRFTLLLAIAIMSCSAALAQNLSEKMNFTNFTSIDAEYAYQINVTKGSSNTIEVIYPERFKEYLKIFVSGETLNLSTEFPKKNLWMNSDVVMEIWKSALEDWRKGQVNFYNLFQGKMGKKCTVLCTLLLLVGVVFTGCKKEESDAGVSEMAQKSEKEAVSGQGI